MDKKCQGDVYWGNLPHPFGRRPVLILTRTPAMRYLYHVTVAPLTEIIRNIPTEVVVSPAEGVPALCAVSLDNIQTISKARLDDWITHLSDETMAEVFEAIRVVFAMPDTAGR